MSSPCFSAGSGLVVIYYHQLRSRIQYYVAQYQQFFIEQGLQVEVLSSSPSRSQDIKRLTSIRDRLVELVVIGGDGSVNIAAQVLAGSTLPLSVIPVGTGNDFARDNQLGTWRWRLTERVQQRAVAIGRCGDTYFINHAGAGLTVDLMHLQRPWMKRYLKGYSYVLGVLRYLWGPYARRSCIHAPHNATWHDVQIVAISRFFGGGIPIYPSAHRSKAQLQWVAVPRANRWQQFRALLAVLRGRIATAPGVTVEWGSEFVIGDTEHHIELDGDCWGYGPQKIQAIAAGLTICVPSAKPIAVA